MILGNIVKGWDGYLNKPSKSQQATSKRPRLYECERIFSSCSVMSQHRKDEASQDHPILKRKIQNISPKIAGKSKSIKKSKHKKMKSKKNRAPFESSSEDVGIFAPMKSDSGSVDDDISVNT